MLAPCRRVLRLWPVLLSISALSVVLLWRSHDDEEAALDATDRDGWVAVR
jgi:peptidoglycan/LPS O-acetylase OafA/YrhL